MYKLQNTSQSKLAECVIRLSDGACIPFSPDNTDYQTFLVYLNNGGSLQDPDGNVMTQEQVDEFLRTIP